MSAKSEPTGTKHVAVVGETGTGKSTLVNLLTGTNSARANNDVVPCTEKLNSYPLRNDSGVEYTLWDTRGWNEALGEEEATSPIARFLKFLRRVPSAERKLLKFLRSKDRRISLILFCIEAGKIGHDAEWKNYKKIFVKFCKRKTKVAVVVTRMRSMDDNTRKMCVHQVEKAVGRSFKLDSELIEAGDCRSGILKLISEFS